MSLINAYYRFKLNPSAEEHISTIQPLQKVGNNEYFDEFFNVSGNVKFRVMCKPTERRDQLSYLIRYSGKGCTNPLFIFDSNSAFYPYGEIDIEDNMNCILAKEIEPNTFEIYVFNDERSEAPILMNILLQGSLQNEIDDLRKL